MTKRQAVSRARLFERLANLGFSEGATEALLRIERTLQRWGELECGDSNEFAAWSVERDEATGRPFMVTHFNGGKTQRRAVADREAGAVKRLAKIMAGRQGLQAYHQGDCRGCSLYIIRTEDLRGAALDSGYTVGVAVCF